MIYRVVDSVNGREIAIEATSVGNAAAKAGRIIAGQCRQAGVQYQRPRTDRTTGGWHGLHIEGIGCRHVQMLRPNPKPKSRKQGVAA